jgi:type III pantothenate kinase
VILAVDCGNTRVKWGFSRGQPAVTVDSTGHWLGTGSLPLAELARLGSHWSGQPEVSAVAVANVAGAGAHASLAAALRRFGPEPIWVTAQARQCGVTNGYTVPAQLGADRWAALIGARHLYAGTCLVVTAGTATTVDILDATGVFRGGVILPGAKLMQWALSQRTAGLPQASGSFADEPRSTADAIETGSVMAQVGAIERMFARLEKGALCLLSGGAADSFAARLNVPLRVVDNLVLEGLARIAAETA